MLLDGVNTMLQIAGQAETEGQEEASHHPGSGGRRWYDQEFKTSPSEAVCWAASYVSVVLGSFGFAFSAWSGLELSFLSAICFGPSISFR